MTNQRLSGAAGGTDSGEVACLRFPELISAGGGVDGHANRSSNRIGHGQQSEGAPDVPEILVRAQADKGSGGLAARASRLSNPARQQKVSFSGARRVIQTPSARRAFSGAA